MTAELSDFEARHAAAAMRLPPQACTKGKERQDLTESALDLSSFALHKQINPLMLVREDVKESILKLNQLIVTSAWHRY